MTERQFIEKNKDSWSELEELLKNKYSDPEKIQSLFVKVSGDLSYARTYYPKRAVRVYLNNLVSRVFNQVKKPKKFNFLKLIRTFYTRDLPEQIIYNWKAFAVSFVVFSAAIFVGIFSSFEDSAFASEILGNAYIAMTEANIAQEDPMAVYKSMRSDVMFFEITANNIRVAFLAFVLGLLASVGTLFILVHNGIMVGAFQTFFYQQGLFLTSFLTIWIHGTIEIASVVVAGAAGIIMGNGLLFPGTYSRGIALRISVIRGLTILLSTVPLFIIAGFLESYVTRLTELPDYLKGGIILASLALILSIYVIYPMVYYKKGLYRGGDIDLKFFPPLKGNPPQSSWVRGIRLLLDKFPPLLSGVAFPAGLLFLLLSGFILLVNSNAILTYFPASVFDEFKLFSPWAFLLFSVGAAFALAKTSAILFSEQSDWNFTLRLLKDNWAVIGMTALFFVFLAYFLNLVLLFLLFFALPLMGIMAALKEMGEKGKISPARFFYFLKQNIRMYRYGLGPMASIALVSFLSLLMLNTFVEWIILDFLLMITVFETHYLNWIFFKDLLSFLTVLLIFFLAFGLLSFRFEKSKDIKYGDDLIQRFESFSSFKKTENEL